MGANVGGCPGALIGWATVEGDGVATTTSGTTAPVRRATSSMKLAADDRARDRIARDVRDPRLQVASNETFVGVGADTTMRGQHQRPPAARQRSRAQRRPAQPGRISAARRGRVDSDAVQLSSRIASESIAFESGTGPTVTSTCNWVTVSWSIVRYTAAYARPEGEAAEHPLLQPGRALGRERQESGAAA